MAYLDPVGFKRKINRKPLLNCHHNFTWTVMIRSAPYLRNTTRYFAQLANGGWSGMGGWSISWHRPCIGCVLQDSPLAALGHNRGIGSAYMKRAFGCAILFSSKRFCYWSSWFSHATLDHSGPSRSAGTATGACMQCTPNSQVAWEYHNSVRCASARDIMCTVRYDIVLTFRRDCMMKTSTVQCMVQWRSSSLGRAESWGAMPEWAVFVTLLRSSLRPQSQFRNCDRGRSALQSQRTLR